MVKPSMHLCVLCLGCRAGGAMAHGPDVAGVTLGMAKEQAVRAATERLQVTAGAVRRLPDSVVLTTGVETLTVHFAAGLPGDPRKPPVVDRVTYEMARTARNAALMKQTALRKYGAPSNGTRGFILEWCARPRPNPAYYAIGCLQAPGPVLKLDGTRIELSLPRSGGVAAQETARRPAQLARF